MHGLQSMAETDDVAAIWCFIVSEVGSLGWRNP